MKTSIIPLFLLCGIINASHNTGPYNDPPTVSGPLHSSHMESGTIFPPNVSDGVPETLENKLAAKYILRNIAENVGTYMPSSPPILPHGVLISAQKQLPGPAIADKRDNQKEPRAESGKKFAYPVSRSIQPVSHNGRHGAITDHLQYPQGPAENFTPQQQVIEVRHFIYHIQAAQTPPFPPSYIYGSSPFSGITSVFSAAPGRPSQATCSCCYTPGQPASQPRAPQYHNPQAPRTTQGAISQGLRSREISPASYRAQPNPSHSTPLQRIRSVSR